MKRGKKLILLLIVLAVLIAAAAALLKLAPDDTDAGEEDTGVSVFTLDPEAAAELSWIYEGETITFVKSDGSWKYAGDSAFPLDESTLTAMLTTLSDVAANKTIEAPEDLAQYGLEEPACIVTVTADTTTELLIGDETGIGGERYLSVGDGNVYLVDEDFLDSFSYGLFDLVEKEPIPPMTDVTGLEVASEVQSYTLNRVETDTQEDSGEDIPVWFWNGDSALPLDTDLTEALIETVTAMSWGQCVDYDAADALADYGLDAPTVTVTVNYVETAQEETGEDSNASFVLEIGDYVDGSCYARIAGSRMVYWIDGAIGDSLMSAAYDDLSADAAG